MYRLQFTDSISGIGHRRIMFINGRIILFSYRSEDTKRTDIDKLFGNHIQCLQRLYEITGINIISLFKLFFMTTFSHTRTMNDIIPSSMHLFVNRQLFHQPSGMSKIQFGKPDTGILQILAATAFTHSCPYPHASFLEAFHQQTADKYACSVYQSAFHQNTADNPACSVYQYSFFHSSLSHFTSPVPHEYPHGYLLHIFLSISVRLP